MSRSLGRKLLKTCAGLAVLVVGGTDDLRAQKTDVVILDNGDHITGEIKQLSRGRLEYSTDDAGRLYVEWTKIARVTSRHYFEVELSSGQRYFGQLVPSESDKALVVALDRRDTLDLGAVVGIVPIDAGFTSRLKAFLDVGLSFAKANRAVTLNVATEVAYRGRRWGWKVAGNSYLQNNDSTEATTRNSASVNTSRFLKHRWETGGVLRFEQNDELGLVARFSVGFGGGRRFVQTSSMEFSASIGALVARERFSSGVLGRADTLQNNFEGVASLDWETFRFDSPKLDAGVSLDVFPSISQLGRFRGELVLRLKYELFKDFHVGLSFTGTGDTRPLEDTAAKTDYITSFTIGWSYRT